MDELARIETQLEQRSLRTQRRAIASPARLETLARRKANADLYNETTRIYFDGLPLQQLTDILNRHGFDGAALEGIYCGRSGRVSEKVGERTYLTLNWYKMEVTGRYEIVAYLS